MGRYLYFLQSFPVICPCLIRLALTCMSEEERPEVQSIGASTTSSSSRMGQEPLQTDAFGQVNKQTNTFQNNISKLEAVSCKRPFINFRDKNGNVFLSVSYCETRTRNSVFQSCASRLEREFFAFSLMFRDKNVNFCLSVSCLETRQFS